MGELLTVSVNKLCEKMLPSGDIDMRYGAFRVIESQRLHKKLQKQSGAVYAPDIILKSLFELDDTRVVLDGYADGAIQEENGYILELIKCVNIPVGRIGENFCPTHIAEANCLAYMYATENSLKSITVRLTYCDVKSEESVNFDYYYDTDDLGVFVENILTEYINTEKKRLEKRLAFTKSAKKTPFPYEDYREGQRTFAEYAFEAICTKKKLFAEAPTGIGKTMSALFPAIKASGNGFGEKIFYFTSKTTIARAAMDAFKLLCNKGLKASCIIISAKERTCHSGIDLCDPTRCQNACGHYDRINDCVADAIENDNFFDFDTIKSYSQKYSVCPYELSLALSEWCELVICDYNYLFDPMVYFRRYFTEGGDYIFLVDEAHNLADRARSMYSHSISSTSMEELLINHSPSDSVLFPKLCETLKYMKSAEQLVEVNARKSGNIGVYKSKKPFGKLNDRLKELTEAFDNYFKYKPDADKKIFDMYFEIRKYLKISEYFDEKYVSLIEYRNGEYTFRQVCIDPSGVIKSRFSLGRAAVLFSATLSPADYYKAVLSADDTDLFLVLDSPFPKENLCLATTYKFSTRLDDRKSTVSSLVSMLYTFINSKAGNYIAFFPSYKYMSEVHAAFYKRYPSVKTIIQKSEMSEQERADYLNSFEKSADFTVVAQADKPASTAVPLSILDTGLMRGADFFNQKKLKSDSEHSDEEESTASMLAFGVLGGVFSEGIDYVGDKLIGCAVVGVGLPGINDDSNLICEYYNEHSGDEYMHGYDYAYRIPGMTKVLQAAGRVIRSDKDRGVILLVDDRYATREYTCMYPNHWKHMRLVGNIQSLAQLLKNFWEEKLY